ncbi:DUF262 domain-containing protein [Bradyrhizobium barranii subsp. apii]|uniref:GmrSD restriction endonuclease domain-containing protein n=1 Tax=Bradyrhizobium barranii TaxID=2992140 RepID=UPI001AA16BA9|nr:DUF262 domain-containing protein [Bradyrhizobium barranii]UPT93932.1 DUF262 domain-containing protein [Bradyrhizobium barranii subsp. apii]
MAELASQPTSVQTVYNWYREGRLLVNRRYQRKLVWTLEEKQKLIESLLKKYPVPAILLAEKDGVSGTYEIIDGLQRLHSIVSFIEQAFPLLDQRFFNVEQFPTAKTAASEGAFKVVAATSADLIKPRDVSTILDYSLALSVMRNATDYEVNDVFDRINTYGHRLSDQERRQAGVENEFSTTVRVLSCLLRGDVSADVLPLQDMPSISIDLPMSKHGYEVKADEVFWVSEGILRSTDLRDSLDEQCIADIIACIVGGQLIERAKDALDEIYTKGSIEAERLQSALEIYGADKIRDEIKFCVDELLKVCATDGGVKLRNLIFKKGNTNAFPSVFAVILIAFHETMIGEKKRIADYSGLQGSLKDLSNRIEWGRKATAPEDRRKNIDGVKGIISPNFVTDKKLAKEIYINHTTVDIEAVIRRSEIELPNYELKQGMLTLVPGKIVDPDIVEKVVRTICAIANIGPKSSGKILIGVTDKKADADRAKKIDKIEPKKVGKRHVVGVYREAKRLGITIEKYFQKWKDGIKNSKLTPELRDAVLSSVDFNSFYGLGVIVITVPPRETLSYVADQVYWRNGDSTEEALTPRQIATIASRFPG